MRSPKRLAVMAPIAVAALALTACGSSSKTAGPGTATPAPTTGGVASAPASGSAAPSDDASASASSTPAAIATSPSTPGGTLTFGSDQEPTGFNTNTDKDNGTAAQNVVESILPSVTIGQPDLGYAFNSNLLDGDPVVVSKSPEIIEYKIKPTAVWSDGVQIGLDDFKFAWQTQNGTDKLYMPAGTTGYEDISGIAGTTDDFKVTFKKSFSDWPALFGNLIPYHTTVALSKSVAKFKGDIHAAWYDGYDTALAVSGGPFMLTKYTPTDSAILEKNPKWYGTPANLDKIVVRFLPDSTTQVPALQSKEVNLIYPQPQLDLVDSVKAIAGVTSSVNFGASFEHIDFNTKTPGLDDVMVRKAIATGLNIPNIIARTVKQFSDQAQVLGNRIFLNTQKQYVDNSGTFGKGDTAGAKAMLDAAGYVVGADGIRAKGAVKLSFTFTTTAGNALRMTTFQLFQSQMKDLGIDIKQDIRPSKVVFPDLAAKKFQISLFAWVGTPFPVSSNKSIYVTGGGQNYGSLSDPMVDSMFDSATGELDPTTLAADANAIDKQLWNDMITIPLFQKPTFIAFDDTYVNIMDNGTADGPFFNAADWGMKAA